MLFKLKIFVLIILLYTSVLYAEYSRKGIIESLREDGYITVLLDSKADRDLYYIATGEKIIGNISSLKQIPDVLGKKRYICRYSLINEEYRQILRPGIEIVVTDADKEIDKRVQKNPYIDTINLKPEIISLIDKRDMMLISEGKFLMGCSDCDEDEFPEHIVFLGDYYIDKYEVSNSDYKKYADIKGLPYPDYWNDQLQGITGFKSIYFGSLPVIVTYYEAVDYATWAGKRLPSEEEWEKASRPPASGETPGKAFSYSWEAISGKV